MKTDLRFRSATTTIEDLDFSKIQIDKIKIQKFEKLSKIIQTEKVIDSKEIKGFKVVARTKRFTGASQLKSKSRRQFSFSEAFKNYDNPYSFLISLKNTGIEEVEFYKYFIDIEYKTLNKYGFEVSGGERSEFNLLHEISDALKFDILLIDDNTVGASIKPDFLLYTQKKVIDEKVKYDVFWGHPTSKTLKNAHGEEIQNLEILFNCLEAGKEAYYERKNKAYEILKD